MISEEQSPPTLAVSGDSTVDHDAGELLAALDDSVAFSGRSSPERTRRWIECAQRLADERLGMVSALFAALGCKHPATAAHSLRVAMSCSRWAAAIGMPERLRLQLEAAALLHDIGKIAVPDVLLTKPGRLEPNELRAIDQSHEAARRILTAAQAPEAIIEGVVSTLAWYDGTHRTIKVKSEHAPFISRMIAIADAYDSMTTDQVYRSAYTEERAVGILYEYAGTQFDPGLVTSFVESLKADTGHTKFNLEDRWVAWLGEPEDLAAPWNPVPALTTPQQGAETGFSNGSALGLIESLNDAVICVDTHLQITFWNPAAASMTGVGCEAALGTRFSPGMIALSRDSGDLIDDAACPAKIAIETGLQSIERVNAAGVGGRPMSIDLHVIPLRQGHELNGAALVMHDASSEASLERRCKSLHVENSKDPLTQVANRAEFDRMLPTFVEVHQEIGLPFSLIMSDIDHFKKVNDTHGHQAGDQAIIEFASLLKSMCRSGDLVARYGGEEFAILCADCNTTIAAKRADQIRRQLASMTFDFLHGAAFTASFGVTELQAGDTPETILRRADRALLKAKDEGRNKVVQLGNGMSATNSDSASKGWFGGGGWWFSLGSKTELIRTKLVTNVPIEMAVEKLKGFISDRDAQILKADNNELRLEVVDHDPGCKKPSERHTVFIIEMKLSQEHIEKSNNSGFAAGSYAHTFIEVMLQTKSGKRGKGGRLDERARLMLASLQSYIMAREADSQAPTYMPPQASPEEADENEAVVSEA